ncbi:MAG: alpha/beta hydrolase, partial [Oscillospiraceae bacterium]|nr:alpha/beta hydrolase [Oscillospiraceae bacterium]
MSYNLMPPEDVERMFRRMELVRPDTSAVRRKFLGCPYGEDKRQALDIYLPGDGAGPFPVVIFIHGGAWMSGHRADAQLAPFLPGIERGYAVLSLGYRLIPNIRWPENLFDIKSAL